LLGPCAGSSPRAWGTALTTPLNKPSTRFIPTGVGNGSPFPSHLSTCPVHPHGRGERYLGQADVGREFGSSPRTWGTVSRSSRCRSGIRFIPTDVGNGSASPRPASCKTVHPHGRGERFSICRSEYAYLRFIPTGVGNGLSGRRSQASSAVHPHRRGERILTVVSVALMIGSSPRAWGTDTSDQIGKGSRLVHPHGRGERKGRRCVSASVIGSSPRAWGTGVVNSAG